MMLIKVRIDLVMKLKPFHDMGEHLFDRTGGLNQVATPSLNIFHRHAIRIHFMWHL